MTHHPTDPQARKPLHYLRQSYRALRANHDAPLSAEILPHKNLAYDDVVPKKQNLDVYTVEDAKDRPVMIWVHGGAWRIGDKRGVHEKPNFFIQQGFVLVSVNYRLSSDTTYADQAADIAKAIRWVVDNVDAYGGDADAIFLMGHSAGAHLSALVATDPKYLQQNDLQLSTIQGVILLDGACYDVPLHIESAPRRWPQLFKKIFGEQLESQRDASPTHHAKLNQAPAFLIMYVADRAPSREQSQGLAAALKEGGGTAATFAAEDKTHATINREFGEAEDPPTAKALEFLQQQLATAAAE